jgi:ribosomal protein S8
MNKNIVNAVSLINMASQHRLKSVRFKYVGGKNLLAFLGKLASAGFIRGFNLNKDGYVYVYIKYVDSMPVFSKMINMSLARKQHVNVYKLYHVVDRAQGVFVLSTVKGFKLSDECLIERLGGRLVVKIVL